MSVCGYQSNKNKIKKIMEDERVERQQVDYDTFLRPSRRRYMRPRMTETERLEERIQLLRKKSEVSIMLKNKKQSQVMTVSSADEQLSIKNVVPPFFMGIEPILISAGQSILFFPKSKQALKKSYERAANCTISVEKVADELTANRKVYVGTTGYRKEKVYDPTTVKTYTKRYHSRLKDVDVITTGTQHLVKEGLINALRNDKEFGNMLAERFKESGRTLCYAILGLSEFGLSTMKYADKLEHADQERHFQVAADLFFSGNAKKQELFSALTILLPCIALSPKSDDACKMNCTLLFLFLLTGNKKYINDGGADGVAVVIPDNDDPFSYLIEGSSPERSDALNETLGASVITPTDKGFGFLTGAFMDYENVPDTDQQRKKSGMKGISYNFICAHKGELKHIKAFVDKGVEIVNTIYNNTLIITEASGVTSIANMIGDIFVLYTTAVNEFIVEISRSIEEMYIDKRVEGSTIAQGIARLLCINDIQPPE